jgi:hypothetical protein
MKETSTLICMSCFILWKINTIATFKVKA